MKRKSVLWVALDLVFLIVFNTIFFVVGGTAHSASVWLSYVFIHFAYFMVLITPFLIRKGSSAVVWGFSIYSISSIYFIIEFSVGIVFILLKQDSYKPALVVQIVIAGIYAILLLSHLIANESSANNVKRHEQEVIYTKEVASRVKLMMGKLSDKKTNKEIEKLYDLLRSSPSKSSGAVYSLERSIVDMITELETSIASNDLEITKKIISKTIAAVEERNRKLRQLN